MDAADLERVYQAFQDFHAHFASAFGRRETREHSRHDLQGLLVQSQGAAQRRELVGDGAGVAPRVAAFPDRVALG